MLIYSIYRYKFLATQVYYWRFPLISTSIRCFRAENVEKKKTHMYWGLILFLLNNRRYSVSRHKRWPWHRSTLHTIPEPANQIILRSIIELSGQTRTIVMAFKTTWPLVHQPDFAFLVMVKIDWMLCTPLRWLVWMFVDKNFTAHQKHRFFSKTTMCTLSVNLFFTFCKNFVLAYSEGIIPCWLTRLHFKWSTETGQSNQLSFVCNNQTKNADKRLPVSKKPMLYRWSPCNMIMFPSGIVYLLISVFIKLHNVLSKQPANQSVCFFQLFTVQVFKTRWDSICT